MALKLGQKRTLIGELLYKRQTYVGKVGTGLHAHICPVCGFRAEYKWWGSRDQGERQSASLQSHMESHSIEELERQQMIDALSGEHEQRHGT